MNDPMGYTQRVSALIENVKHLAREYYILTGKPLGVTGEVAEFETAKLLNVELVVAREAGFDAIEQCNGSEKHLQIKSRCLRAGCKSGQQLGSVRIEKEFDAVLMVILDEQLEVQEIYEASRSAVITALTKPGSKARNERGVLSVSKFRAIGKLRWKRDVTGR